MVDGSKSDMQKAWKEWVVELGALPAGNAPGNTTWAVTATGSARAGSTQAAALAKPAAAAGPTLAQLRQRVASHDLPQAVDAITADVLEQLGTRGFAVIDQVLSPGTAALARSGAELLRSSGHLREVSSQRDMGRLDEILVMDEADGTRLLLPGRPSRTHPATLPAGTTSHSSSSSSSGSSSSGSSVVATAGGPSTAGAAAAAAGGGGGGGGGGVGGGVFSAKAQQDEQIRGSSGCQALAGAGALLKSLPHALMQRQRQQQRQGAGLAGGSGARPGLGLGCGWLTELAVPESLMLAIYPGNGAYYARHLDNDTGPAQSVSSPSSTDTSSHDAASNGDSSSKSGPSWQGPPGQRVGDRSITAILYLNSEWDGATDGGQLRLFHADGSGGFTDVEPVAGRVVLFRSRLIEHEVLPAWRPRWAMSAWIPGIEAYL
ncbi:MAG: hypothetical protein WDW38_005696 [Sanguina aurantia]